MRPVVLASLGAALLLASDVPAQLPTTAAYPRKIDSPARPLLAIIRMPERQPVLARLDPLSLEPVGRQVEVGEYHYAWSVSPDGSQLAVATGGGGFGIRIVDLTKMVVVRDVQTGIATEALGWLKPSRLVAVLQRGGIVVVDPANGQILHRYSLSIDLSAHAGRQPAVRSQKGLVALLAAYGRLGPALVALADPDGGVRTVSLEQLPVGSRPGVGSLEERAGFALDPRRGRLLVTAARAPIAEVDLETLSVSYRPLSGSSLRSECPVQPAAEAPLGRGCSSLRRMLWLGADSFALFGEDLRGQVGGRPRRIPAGLAIVDANRWTMRMIDANASLAAAGPGILLAFGGERRAEPKGIGLRGYSLDGRRRFHLFGEEYVFDVHVMGHRAYACSARNQVRIVNLNSGKVVRELETAWAWIDLVDQP